MRVLEAEYAGVNGRPKAEDVKRKNNIQDKKDLNSKISTKKSIK